MDYGSVTGVRLITGLTEKDIQDKEVTAFLSLAQRRFFYDVLDIKYREEALFIEDTVIQTEEYPIASVDNGFNPKPTDIKVEAKADTPGYNMWRQLDVASLDAEHGLVKLANPPASGEQVFITYYYFPGSIDNRDIDEAINYLAAHLISLRLEDPGTISIADLQSNALIVKDDNHRFLTAYRTKVDSILGGATMGVVIL